MLFRSFGDNEGEIGSMYVSLFSDAIPALKFATGMNLLSGVTWKGAKLRLGEAKLDFRER